MKSPKKLLASALLGFAASAGIFCVGLISCTAYAVKNGTVKNPLKKRETQKEEELEP